jgi:hypothetical protein
MEMSKTLLWRAAIFRGGFALDYPPLSEIISLSQSF